MVFPLALRTFQVPCPTQVKLTSAFSAMRYLPLDSPLRSENAILPHAQHEDSDGRDGPDVRKNEIARRSIETEQQDRQHPKREAERHPVGGVPTAAPGGPRSGRSEGERAQI